MSRRKSLCQVLLVGTMCLLASLSWAQSHVRIVHLSYIEGDAQIKHAGADAIFNHAVLNMPVTEGMSLYTPAGGRAEVQFENGSTLRLADDAQARFTRLSLADTGGKLESISLDHGILYANFQRIKKDDEIVISAGDKEIHVAKSAHFRVQADANSVSVAIFHGSAIFDGTELKSGESARLDVANPAPPQIAKGVERASADNWDKRRNDELAALPSSPVTPYSGYDAQFSLLNGYGTFMDMPGYGLLWQPYNMAMGWNPFMDGLWGFYPGMGYTWISPYAWGWLPYRYGQWNYIPSMGWAWAPGSIGNGWNVGPRYVSAPKGFTGPVAPTHVGAIRPGHLVIVGNPPNLHPAITAGKGEIGAKPMTTPVMHNSGLAALHTPRPRPMVPMNQHMAGPVIGASSSPTLTSTTPSHSSGSGKPK